MNPDGKANERPGTHVGQPVLRLEDDRLLRGRARFADDVDLRGQLHMRIVRSPVAHGEIRSVDASAAEALPGVALVLRGKDVEELGTVPLEQIGYHEIFPDLEAFGHPLLAVDRVLYVGQPVAAVLAEDPYVAEDAADLVFVDYEPLPVVLDPVEALAPGAPELHPGKGNEGARFERRYGDIDAAFAAAAHRVSLELRMGRHTGMPMETRNIVVDYDRSRDHLSVWGVVHVHDTRRLMAAMLGMPLSSISTRPTDLGGNFGVRGGIFPEYVLAAFAARRIDRPVKWVEDRAEHLVATSHAREQVHRIEGAFDADGRLLGLRDEIWHNKGAFFRQAAPLITDITVGMVCGPYRVPAYDGRIHAVLTNKTPSGAYRAPGRYEATFARERLLDSAAAELGIDPVEIRRRNLLTEDDLPWEPGFEIVFEPVSYNSGDVLAHFEKALPAADLEGMRAEATELRAAGRVVGVGIGVLMDKAGLGLYETAAIEVDPTGRIRVMTGGSSVGQGIETVLAQIVADELTVDPGQIDVIHGDTDLIPDGVGSWSSRSTVIAGGAAINAARRTREKAFRIAAGLLEVAEGDLDLQGGSVVVRGVPDRRLTLAEIAAAWDGWTARLAGDEPGLGGRDVYLEEHMNYPYGVTVVQLEIDRRTGGATLRRFFTSCEAGRAINPLTTAGQVIGAAAQGIGGALFEELAYDEDGQPLATSFIDYLLPTATEVPPIELLVCEDAPTPDNPLRAKGIGEVGLIAVGAAIAAAVDDAVGVPGLVAKLPLSPADLLALVEPVRA
ncbi:MAG: xanthine dehydrogenase family protein molybdopterin-binding subunit [Actinobacteria bacterium]|nr:xanthine dehydrogenase family protein molybdopterin-binding subunit [Actinomycetota bacterium]